MEDYLVNLKECIKKKDYLDDQQLISISESICEHFVSDKVLDNVLKYLEMYSQQIAIIPKSNYHFIFIFII